MIGCEASGGCARGIFFPKLMAIIVLVLLLLLLLLEIEAAALSAEKKKKKHANQKNESKRKRRMCLRAELEASKTNTFALGATSEVEFNDVNFQTRGECEQACRNEAAFMGMQGGVRVEGNINYLKVSCPRYIYHNGLKVHCPFIRYFRRKIHGY